MANPAPTPAVPSVAAILDQLNELETLMQRMLDLPVTPQPGEEAPAPPAAAVLPPPPPPVPPEPRPQSLAESTAFRQVPASPPQVAASAPLRQETPLRNEQEEGAEPMPRAAVPRPEPRVKFGATPRPTVFAPPALSFWLRPLVWLDELFQTALIPLGPVGRAASSNTGRTLLGLLGLGLLSGALAWGVWDWHSTREARHLAPTHQGR